MTDDQFWKLIDSTRRIAKGDPNAHIEALTAALAELPEAEIIAFDDHFAEHWNRAYTWDLWGAAYIIGGGCSDDGFMDFRGWLISKGRKVYEAALQDAESLTRAVKEADEDCQVEGFQYAAPAAWERVTGKDNVDFPASRGPSPEAPAGAPWEDDDLPERFPKLWRKFDEQ
jgi:hypothetical protein